MQSEVRSFGQQNCHDKPILDMVDRFTASATPDVLANTVSELQLFEMLQQSCSPINLNQLNYSQVSQGNTDFSLQNTLNHVLSSLDASRSQASQAKLFGILDPQQAALHYRDCNMYNQGPAATALRQMAMPANVLNATMSLAAQNSMQLTSVASLTPPLTGRGPLLSPHAIISANLSNLSDESRQQTVKVQVRKRRRYNHESFPFKLYRIIQESVDRGQGDIISWCKDGSGFEIHQPREFEENVIPIYFRHKRMASFRRQLSMYGFRRGTSIHDAGRYAHELFHRDNPKRCKDIKRLTEFKLIMM